MPSSPARRLGARLPLVSAGLAALGVAVSAYLTAIHYDEGLLVCGLSDCHTVQASDYAEILGIPVALLGLGMYVALLALFALRRLRPALAVEATATTFALALAGALFAGYLTYVELFVLEALCQWCVVSAALTTLLLFTEGALASRLLARDAP